MLNKLKALLYSAAGYTLRANRHNAAARRLVGEERTEVLFKRWDGLLRRLAK